ncbi:hypothetical protein SMY61_003233 [Cronobacter sakazakii]|nr:hypothetical protein [Cronobacter sakazakii]ELY4364597.1 hypothetical protein [Cronobacter sakazakii]
MTDTAKLKAAALAATALNLDSAEIKREDECVECPVCCGEGYVDVDADFCNIDGVALGVLFYGIGEQHGAAEEYLRAANPAAVLELIAALEAKDAQIAELLEKQRLIDICQGQGLEHRIAAERHAEAAEKRVAELERQAIQPLPIGELINRLEEQTGEPWGEVYLAGINLIQGVKRD